MNIFKKSLLKRNKRVTQNSVNGKKAPIRKKAYSKSKKTVKKPIGKNKRICFLTLLVLFILFSIIEIIVI